PTATFHPRTMAPNAHCAPAPCSARSPMDSAPSGGPSSTPTSAPSSKPHAAVPSEPSKQSVLLSPERPWRRQHSRRKVSNYGSAATAYRGQGKKPTPRGLRIERRSPPHRSRRHLED